MPVRNIVLDDQQDGWIDALVQSGRFSNAGEVIVEGLRLVQGRETEAADKTNALRSAAALGLAALNRGAFKEFSDAAALVGHLETIALRRQAERKGDRFGGTT